MLNLSLSVRFGLRKSVLLNSFLLLGGLAGMRHCRPSVIQIKRIELMPFLGRIKGLACVSTQCSCEDMLCRLAIARL